MTLTNKDYFVKGSRWYWYSNFLILLNIICPIIFEAIFGVLFIINEDEELLIPVISLIPFIILLCIFTIKFKKDILKREQGFSIILLIIVSIFYFIYLSIACAGFAGISEFYEFKDSLYMAITVPFVLGPFFLFINFITSYLCHKKGLIPADKKDKKLLALGVISIIISIFYQIIIIFIIICLIFIFSSKDSFVGTSRKPTKVIKYCKNCGAEIKKDATYCSSCEKNIKKENNYCGNCGAKIEKDATYCSSCGKKL